MEIRLTLPRLIAIVVLVGGAGTCFLLDWLIITDAERVEMTLHELEKAVEKNDVDAVMPFLDDSFRMARMNKAEFHKWYGKLLEKMHVIGTSQYDTTVEIDEADPDRAIAVVLSIINLENPPGDHRIDWRLEFRRRGEVNWKLLGVRAFLPINRSEIPLGSAPEYIP